jgi:hypothetical protein
MDMTPEQTYALIAVASAFFGFIAKNIGVVIEWLKVLYRGLTFVFKVFSRLSQHDKSIELLETRMDRAEKLLMILFEQLDINPEDPEATADTLADLASHEQELILAWRKMRES